MKQQTIALTIERIYSDYKYKTLIINKDYQRDYVWKEQNIKSELIRSLINIYPTGTLIFWHTENHDLDQLSLINEIIDGQQRLITIFDFIDGKFSLSKNITKKIISQNEKWLKISSEKGDKKSLNLIQGKIDRISIKNIPEFLKRNILTYNMSVVSITNTNIDEIKEYFSVVQNQEKLKAGELIHSLPKNLISSYFDDNILELMAKILNFNNKRKDILKQLHMVVGLNLEKLRMGAMDKEIVKLATKINKSEINKETSKILENIITDFKNASLQDLPQYKKKFKVFGIKLLFLTYVFPESDFKKNRIFEKINIIKTITEYSGKFNSSDLKKKNEIPNEIFDDMEQIWKLSKTTHSKKAIQKIFNNHFYKVVYFIQKEVGAKWV